ncbi:hypothetical protein AcW2_005989 [Taiwanofungus camphoratus]|nr:hypothetical protein AcW2_005989 [Antrodia cinnamomea]
MQDAQACPEESSVVSHPPLFSQMPKHHQLSVSIVCDKKAFKEYSVKIENERTISCFIASEAGKTFKIRCKNRLSTHAVGFNNYIDGRYQSGRICDPHERMECKGVMISAESLRPFYFADIVTTDDDTIADPESAGLNAIGCIEIRVYRVSYDLNSECNKYEECRETGPVHESSKMAGTHCVSFGDAIEYHSRKITVGYIDHENCPYATFKFFYKPRSVLQAQRIIRSRPLQVAEDTGALSGSQDTTIRRTRSPDADPPAANRAPKKPRTDNHAPEDVNPVIKLESASGVDVKPAIPDQNDDDELVAMKQQLQALQSRIESMEANRRPQTGSSLRVKREALERGVSRKERGTPITIDLTDD